MATTSLLSSPKQTTPCGVCYPHRRVWQVCANQAGVLHTDVFYHIEGRGVHVNGEGQQHDDVKVDGVHHAWVKGKEFWLACLKSKVRCNPAKGNITKRSCRGQWNSKFDALLTGQGHIKGKRVRRVLVEEEDEFIIMLIIKVSLAGCSEWKTLHFTFSTWISLIYFVYTAWIWLLFFVFLFLWLICGVLFGFYILLDRLFLHFFYTFNLHWQEWEEVLIYSLLCSLPKGCFMAAQGEINIAFCVFNLHFTNIFCLHSINLSAILCFFVPVAWQRWFVRY